MGIPLGLGSYLSIGKESTWGTAVSRTIHRPLISTDLQRRIPFAPRPHMLGTLTGIAAKSHFATAEEAGGSFEVEAHYQGIGILLEHGMGVSASSGGPTYTHHYSLDRGAGVGLTLELGRGADEAAAGHYEIFEGFRASKMELVARVGDIMRLKMEGIAQTAQARSSSSQPTLGTDNPILPELQAGALSWNSRSIYLSEASFIVDRKLQRRSGFRSGFTAQPTPSGMCEVTMRCVADLEGDALNNLYADYLAGTLGGDATLTFTGTSPATMIWRLDQAQIIECTEPVDGPGPLRTTFVLAGHYVDSNNTGAKITITNADSSAIAA